MEAKFLMLILLGVIFTLLVLFLFPPIYASYISQDVAVKSAYKITESIISATNMVSSFDEYTRVNVSVNCSGCSKCLISFYEGERYINTGVNYVPKVFLAQQEPIKSNFGLFTLQNYTSPQKVINCTTEKKIIIEKNKGNITIFEAGWTGEECGGETEPCCDGECAEGLSCNSTGFCEKCKRFCPPKTCEGGFWDNFWCHATCITEEKCIGETDDPPTCTYKEWSYGCRTRHCVADCYVDCERCGS